MSSWSVTRALDALFDSFDEAFPERDHGTDGSIGDEAHQDHTSGHNPDDTSGSKSEYTDSDSKAEVRAIDVDADLRCSGVSMQDVVDAIIAEPDDRRRLAYIIFDENIYSASNGFERADYDGDNPHTAHAHFSGDPDYDEDASPWISVLNMGDGMAYSEGDMQAFPWQYTGRGIGSNNGEDITYSTLWYFDQVFRGVTDLQALLVRVPDDLTARLDAILTAAQDDGQLDVVLPPADQATLDEIKAFLYSLPQATAVATVDELGDRLIADSA